MDMSNKVDSFERFGMINPSEVFAKSVSESTQYFRAISFESNVYPKHIVEESNDTGFAPK